MRVYLIDPGRKLITQTMIMHDTVLQEMKRLIGAEVLGRARISPRDHVWVDDQGFQRDDTPPCFSIDGYGAPLAGKAVVLGHDGWGEPCAPSMSLSGLTARVQWWTQGECQRHRGAGPAPQRGTGRAGMKVKALTIWQPWASLIIAGAKRFEFRRWQAPRHVRLRRIVIHAGAREVQREDLQQIRYALELGESSLDAELALPILERAAALPLAAGLGTAKLGLPRKATEFFGDSDRVDHHLWAWPLSEVEPFEPIVPMRGAQGFWDWPERVTAHDAHR